MVIGKSGRGAEGKSIIAVAVEINSRKTGRMRLAKIPKATSEALSGFIENNIEKSSKIISDAWTGYTGLDKLRYEHEIKNSTVKDGDEEILPKDFSKLTTTTKLNVQAYESKPLQLTLIEKV